MSDARWIEIFDDIRWSVEIDRAGGFGGGHLDAYKARMAALMQAMQAGTPPWKGPWSASWRCSARRSPSARPIMRISFAG